MDGGKRPHRRHLQRIISIEEDHLPQLLQDDYQAQLRDWSEEGEEAEEEEEEEEERIDLKMSSIYPPSSPSSITREQQQAETPTSPRGQPVGKETIVNVSICTQEKLRTQEQVWAYLTEVTDTRAILMYANNCIPSVIVWNTGHKVSTHNLGI